MRKRLLVFVLFAASTGALASSCADLPPIDRDVCGNQVIDRELGEECDGFFPPELVSACRAVRGDATDVGDPCAFACAAAGDEAACQLVADGTSTFCPIGYGLGSDGVCRRPSGLFAREPFFRSEVVNLEGQVEDFDGDGVNDLLLTLGQDLTRLVYFRDGGQPTLELPIPAAIATAGRISADAGSDPAADLVVPQGPVMITFRGSEGPQLLAKAYAPFVNPIEGADVYAYRIAPGASATLGIPPGFDVPLLRVETSDGDLELRPIDVTTFTVGQPVVTFTGVADEVLGAPVFVDLRADGPAASNSALEPQLEVAVATPSRVIVATTLDQQTNVLPAPGESIVAFFPMMGGPKPGAVALLTDGSTRFLRVLEAETLAPMTPIQLGDRIDLPAPLSNVQPDAPQPLAIGFINQDDDPDLVTAGGVLFALPKLAGGFSYGSPFETGTEPWRAARIGDIHGDGRNEVIALPTTGDVAVLLPGTGFTLNPALVSVSGEPKLLELGDFDGDSVGDVLVVSETATGSVGVGACNTEDSLSILFGRTAGPPEDPTLIGSLRGVRRVLPMRFYFEGLLDGISDIGVQTRCTPEGDSQERVGVFLGSTSRIVSSPFSPYAGIFDRDPSIERVAIGDLTGPAKSDPLDLHLDAAIVGTLRSGSAPTPYQREVRTVAIVGDAEMIDIGEATILSTSDTEADLLNHVPGIAVGPLFSGSASDEIVVFSSVRTTAGVKSQLDVIERGGAAPRRQTLPVRDPTNDQDSIGRVRLFDFDGDGDLDVFAVATNQPEGFLFLNDGAALTEAPLGKPGAFDVADLAPASCYAAEPACEAGKSLVITDSLAGRLDACSPGDVTNCSPAILEDELLLSVFLGDLDSDGLEDAALVTNLRTEIYAQCSQSDVAKGLCGAELGSGAP